jgi:hypothetical protein
MNRQAQFYTAPANDLALAVLLNDTFEMSKPTIKVLERKERLSGLPLEGREGYSYTVELTDEAGKKTFREIYMFCSEGNKRNYNLIDFVAVGAEGDKFDQTPAKERWADDVVITPEIKEALDLFDHPSKAKDKYELDGAAARAFEMS